jgi:hypothetical protein
VQLALEAVFDLIPGPLVLGFLLAPDVFPCLRELLQGGGEVRLWKGVELFDAQDGHILQPP